MIVFHGVAALLALRVHDAPACQTACFDRNFPLVVPRLLIVLCIFILLYKSESESRVTVAIQHALDQERKTHYVSELNAARTEARLMFELTSGFSQLHHVLKNMLVGIQVTRMCPVRGACPLSPVPSPWVPCFPSNSANLTV